MRADNPVFYLSLPGQKLAFSGQKALFTCRLYQIAPFQLSLPASTFGRYSRNPAGTSCGFPQRSSAITPYLRNSMTNLFTKSFDRTGQCKRALLPSGSPRRAYLRSSAAWLAPAVFLVGALPALAQSTTADILGTVADATGAIIPNATVRLEDLGTHRPHAHSRTRAVSTTLRCCSRAATPCRWPPRASRPSGLRDQRERRRPRARRRQAAGRGHGAGRRGHAQSPLLQADSVNVTTTITTEAVQNLPTAQRNLTAWSS